MLRKCLLFMSVGIFASAFSQSVNTKKLDEYFQILEQNHKVMGSFAIAKDDKIVYSKAIGFSEAENRKKADQNTVYRIGSISKTFTSVLVMKAVEEGKMKLTDTLAKFFPEIKNADKITIENLLQHTSGIHNFTDDVQDYYSYSTKPVSEKDLVAKIQKGGSDFEPGAESSYSNSNYVLLGFILEKIYKKPYAVLVGEKISKPLDLKFTKVGEKIDPSKNVAYSYKYHNSQYEKSWETDMSVPIGAGNLVSTPSELLKFMIALANGKLVKNESLKKMQNYRDHYGFGLAEVPFNAKKGFGHNGAIDDFQSVLYYFPDGKAAFAMITNQSNYDNNLISINALKAAYGEDFEIPTFKVVSLSENEMKAFTGTYSSKNFPLKIDIFLENGKLFAQATGQSSFPLEAVSKNSFQFEMAGITMVFDAGKNQMHYSQMGQNIIFSKEQTK